MSLYPQYARPRSLEQAASLLAGLGTGAMVFAGGQELMPSMNYGKLDLEVIVDVNGIPDLRGVDYEDGELSIGALTVHRDVQTSEVVQAHAPLLAHAAGRVGGGWQVHNRGTIGGNIVSMHPLYDIVPPLLALDAAVDIRDADGEQRQRLADLMRDTSHGLGVTSLLTRIRVPAMPDQAGWRYEKLKTTQGAYGAANAACVVAVDDDGALSTLSLAVGGASDLPVLLTDRVSGLLGKPARESTLSQVEQIAADAIKTPLSDHQGHAEYRKAMAGVMARRAVAGALADIGAAP